MTPNCTRALGFTFVKRHLEGSLGLRFQTRERREKFEQARIKLGKRRQASRWCQRLF